jgi:hypothetical protein
MGLPDRQTPDAGRRGEQVIGACTKRAVVHPSPAIARPPRPTKARLADEVLSEGTLPARTGRRCPSTKDVSGEQPSARASPLQLTQDVC